MQRKEGVRHSGRPLCFLRLGLSRKSRGAPRDPLEANLTDGRGTYLWDGAAGTWFWVDPANDAVFVAMIQRMGSPDNHYLQYRAHALVYQALVEPGK